MITLTLPLSPTINHAYGHSKFGGKYLKPPGKKYRQDVADIVAEAGIKTLEGRVSVFAAIHPADKRKSDLDNRCKALQDALTHAGVWLDDEQIDSLHLVRREIIKGGKIVVVITEIE